MCQDVTIDDTVHNTSIKGKISKTYRQSQTLK